MAEKTRLRRKDLKQPDEFVTLGSAALVWLRAHQQAATWVAGGLVAAVIGVGLATAYRAAQNRDANADLARAMGKIESGDYRDASTQLLEVASRWSGTGIAPVAALLAGNAALRAGNPDAAIAEFANLEAAAEALPPYLQQQLLLAWGAALEAKQQWLDAAAKYQAAAGLSGPYTGEAILAEARTRELGGEADRARQLYRQAYDQFPDLPDRELAASKVDL